MRVLLLDLVRVAQLLFPDPLERASDNAVLRVDGAILPSTALGIVTCPLALREHCRSISRLPLRPTRRPPRLRRQCRQDQPLDFVQFALAFATEPVGDADARKHDVEPRHRRLAGRDESVEVRLDGHRQDAGPPASTLRGDTELSSCGAGEAAQDGLCFRLTQPERGRVLDHLVVLPADQLPVDWPRQHGLQAR